MAAKTVDHGAGGDTEAAGSEGGVLARLSRKVDVGLATAFGKLGKLTATRPGTVIACTLVLFMATMAGIGQLESESRSEKLWAPSGGTDVVHLAEVSSAFTAATRRSSLLVLAKNEGDNVLTRAAMDEMLDLFDDLRTLKVTAAGSDGVEREWSYDDLCYAGGRGGCSFSSVLDVYNNDREAIDAAADGEGGLPRDLTRIRDLGIVPEFVFASGLGGEKEDEDGVMTSAAVMRVSIELENRQYLNAGNEYVDPPAEAWEEAAVADVILPPDAQTFTHIRVLPDISHYSRLESSRAIRGDIAFVGAAIMLIVAYLILQLGNCTCVGSRVLLSFGGLATIGMSLGTAYGLGALLSPSTPVHTVLPFLLAGIGSDDLYVVINEFDLAFGKMVKARGTRTLASADIVIVMTQALAHAGASITVTSLTNFAAFVISSFTVLPALSSFCIWAAIGIAFAFIYTVTLFASFVVLDARRQSAQRADCLPCIKREAVKVDGDNPTGNVGCCGRKDGEVMRSFIANKYAPFLMTTPVRVAVLIGFAAWAGVSVYGFSQLTIEFRREWFLPGDSFLQEYYSVNRQYFSHVGTPVAVYAKDFEPADERGFLNNIETTLEGNRYIDDVMPTRNWFAAFKAHLAASDVDVLMMPKDDFNDELSAFLANPATGAQFAGDVIFATDASGDATSAIKMMRVSSFYIGMSGATDELDAMLTLIDDVDALAATHGMAGKAYAFSFAYTSWRQFEIIPTEAVQNVGFAVVAVFVVLLLFIANLRAALIVTGVVALALVDVLGFYHFWGLYLDAVSVVQLALAVGLVVDYSSHIAHAVMHATGTRKERASAALAEMGISVLNGAISTFLAVCLLSLSQSYIFVVFFKSFFMTCVFGAAHALIFLPVIMSWIAPPPLASAKPAHGDGDGSVIDVEAAAIEMPRTRSDSIG
uniref:SSD domain-containing protein n=1 Tax=Bicosoecida sp. CB-2014 TaxID=1486930 RepID=A0A7S1G6N4_9STRA|mmetsp:Transcript_17260/g.60640  ORF Transcript_17260/g.60640 Transcript_17260/m.60640 type:complete len:928 (+) Transcript_17260:1602-4385(+)